MPAFYDLISKERYTYSAPVLNEGFSSMLSMSFLTHRSVDGLEFINFQTDDFYVKMSSFLQENINDQFVLSKDVGPGIKSILAEFTGFRNVTIKLVEEANLSVDVGYFSPKHVVNHPLADELLKPHKSNLFRWFSENKGKIFEGNVNYKTGKVEGSFCDIPITLMINVNLKEIFPDDVVKKYGIPYHGLLAAGLAHESGHCYGACALLATSAKDNIIAKAALAHYREARNDDEKVIVLKDMGQLLELKQEKLEELQAIAQTRDENGVILYFNKLVNKRNSSRALSLGVQTMSSEVIADVYAIRMGCGKATVAAIGALVDRGIIKTFMDSFIAAVFYTAIVGCLFLGTWVQLLLMGASWSFLLGFGGFTFAISFIFAYFGPGFSGMYNANHRRFEDAVRQLIAKLREVKDMPLDEKKELLGDIEKMLKINKELQPWYENTGIRRFYGWMINGSDFKKQELEHFTQAMVNGEMNVLAERLKLVAKE